METIKELVLECDFFAHGTFTRYRHGDSFPTLTGGFISVIWVSLFVGMFANLALDTFNNNIIASELSVSFDNDPTSAPLISSPSNNFMFAIGITGINLAGSQRYFDISLRDRTNTKYSNGTKTSVKLSVPLEPCTLSHWEGVSESITESYTSLSFSEWLCPPIGYNFALEGKYTSSVFRFADIRINSCTANNSNFPNTTCLNQTDIDTFLTSMGQFTFNFYYINRVINAN